MGANDIVYLMAQELKRLCDMTVVDVNCYSKTPSEWVSNDYSFDKNTPVRWLDTGKVLDLIEKVNPDFILVNAGGISLHLDIFSELKRRNIVTAGIALSDPDWFSCHGRIFSRHYDIYFTNSLYSLENQYAKNTNVRIFPFAASSLLHRPLPEVEKIYDVVVVGHARPERKRIVGMLQKHFAVGLFGDGWGGDAGAVNGEKHVEAINSGKIYFSFASTCANFINVKVGLFEAAACGSFILTRQFDELSRYFRYGLEVVGYEQEKDLPLIVKWYLENDHLRNWVAGNCYQRFLKDHTLEHRMQRVLDEISRCKLG